MDNECIKNSPWMVSRTFGRGHSRDVYSVTLYLEESQKRGFTQPVDQDTEEKLRQRNIILFLVKGKKIVMKV